jgi:hypothetical protein
VNEGNVALPIGGKVGGRAHGRLVMAVIAMAHSIRTRGKEVAAATAARLRVELAYEERPSETPVLDVEVDSRTIRLAGVLDNEQAIACIEDYLRGRAALTDVPAHALPPPGLLG